MDYKFRPTFSLCLATLIAASVLSACGEKKVVHGAQQQMVELSQAHQRQ